MGARVAGCLSAPDTCRLRRPRWPRFSGRVSKTTPPGCSRPGSLHPHSSSETRQGSTPKPREVPVTHTGRGRGVRAASPPHAGICLAAGRCHFPARSSAGISSRARCSLSKEGRQARARAR
uniref:Uncharacterized protein n=1 Tax=Rousettus aegyptiacus TaxID=9407 RepID=A0A7J8DIB4_ROUAE|nr:hypothetical protein HJG63_008714 [Rousettus aegyptiacus]